MKTTNQVIVAVKNGEAVTELELKCAIITLDTWKNSLFYDLARALVESEEEGKLTPKTIRGFKRAWESLHQNFDKDLQTFIMGSSFEPGISKEEKQKRQVESTTQAANKLLDVLTGKNNGT